MKSKLNLYTAEIEACIEHFKAAWPDIEVPPIVYNGRLRRAVARFVFKRRERTPVKIDVSAEMLTFDSERFCQTLLHELAHVADLALYGNANHGFDWQLCMARLGVTPHRLYNPAQVVAIPCSVLIKIDQLRKTA